MDTAETPASAPAESAEGDKLDQLINSAFDTVEAETSAPEESQQEKADRLRDERGRFASKAPAEGDAPVTDQAKPDANPAEATTEIAPEAQPLQPPHKWSEADKAEFLKAPRPLQEYLLRRDRETEADYTRKTQEFAEQRKAVEPLIGEVQRLNPLLQHLGMSPHQFMAESASVAHNLLSGTPEQRANAVAYLVNLHQVPAQAVVQALGIPLQRGDDGQATADPQYANLSQTVTQLQSELQRMRQQAQEDQRSRAEYEFNALALAKDESGQAKFPHFERVRQTMLQLAAHGQADTWDVAYNKAVRLDDDLHKEIIETERKRVQADLERQRQESVEKAKKAAPIRETNSMPRGDASKKGLDAHLDAALTRAGVA